MTMRARCRQSVSRSLRGVQTGGKETHEKLAAGFALTVQLLIKKYPEYYEREEADR
jgi:hypothetical protein